MFLPGFLRAVKVDMEEVQVPLLFYTDLSEAVRGTGECLGAGNHHQVVPKTSSKCFYKPMPVVKLLTKTSKFKRPSLHVFRKIMLCSNKQDFY